MAQRNLLATLIGWFHAKRTPPRDERSTQDASPADPERSEQQGSVIKTSELPDDNYPLW